MSKQKVFLSDETEFCYKVIEFHDFGFESNLAWNVPEIGIE